MAIFWLLLASLLVLLVQGRLLGKGALKKLSYERHFTAATCHAGDKIEMVETIENAKRLPVPWLRLEALLPASLSFQGARDTLVSEGSIYQNHTSLFTLPARTRITRTHQLICTKRGIFKVDTATMTGGDLFALFTGQHQVILSQRLVVYPALFAEGELPASWKTWQGELAVRRWIVEDPFLVTGLRPYSPRDPLNRIHWKASARTGELQVHKHGYSADPRVMLLLNIEESEAMWSQVTKPELLEDAISYAATCAASLIAQGMAVGFGHNARAEGDESVYLRVEMDFGRLHLESLLEAMAAVQLKSRMSFHEYLRLEAERESAQSIDYLIISAHVSELMQQSIDRLRRQGHHVTVASGVQRKGEIA